MSRSFGSEVSPRESTTRRSAHLRRDSFSTVASFSTTYSNLEPNGGAYPSTPRLLPLAQEQLNADADAEAEPVEPPFPVGAYKVVLRTALAILRMNRGELLQSDFGDALQFLVCEAPRRVDSERLVRAASALKMPRREVLAAMTQAASGRLRGRLEFALSPEEEQERVELAEEAYQRYDEMHRQVDTARRLQRNRSVRFSDES